MIDRRRKDDAAIADEDIRQRLPRLARSGRADPQDVPPDDELQQHRDVADGLDIDRSELADQPIARQARNAEQGSENGGKDDADTRDAQRIEQPDEECTAISTGRRILDQRFADLERRLAVEEAEAGGDALATEIDLLIVDGG